jgi:hypothetical protein
MNHICHECREPIESGHAVLRAVRFERIAFHRECWALHMLPAQRQAERRLAGNDL